MYIQRWGNLDQVPGILQPTCKQPVCFWPHSKFEQLAQVVDPEGPCGS